VATAIPKVICGRVFSAYRDTLFMLSFPPLKPHRDC
jgi:hypothetical protein